MCDYCNGKDLPCRHNSEFWIAEYDDGTYGVEGIVSGSVEGKIFVSIGAINYCPMCGRKLTHS